MFSQILLMVTIYFGGLDFIYSKRYDGDISFKGDNSCFYAALW
jgi:hypothetical protein